MRRVAATPSWWSLPLVLVLAGCGQNGYAVAPYPVTAPASLPPPPNQQAQAAVVRNQALENRARALDRDNQELESLLAQSRQQIQLLKDELGAVQGQLRTTNDQLAQLRSEKQGLEQKTQAMVASMQRRPQVEIRPNNSLLMDLKLKSLPGVRVRQDGDVIRAELPADKLFQPGSANLTAAGQQLLATVGADLLRSYPNQIIGIEGHTDSQPIRTLQFPSSHHLSIARATAVYSYLSGPLRVPSQQLVVIGHGGNHPVVSNATSAGKARNRRIELVVYPETFRR
jgi:flagellar motor protein MotB